MALQFVPKGTIYQDEAEKLRLESRNGVIQAEFVIYTATSWESVGTRLNPDLILKLQELAVNQIYRCAGHFRDGEVIIQSESARIKHSPPNHTKIPDLVDEMCAYVHRNWDRSALHLASFVMWRLNWIHPFFGGNGRTARSASYLVLCARLGFALPGSPTIPELILAERGPYYAALRAADAAAQVGDVDVNAMEALLSRLLAEQLLKIHKLAVGTEEADA